MSANVCKKGPDELCQDNRQYIGDLQKRKEPLSKRSKLKTCEKTRRSA